MRRIFWTQTLICSIFALWQSHRCDVANSGHFVFLGDVAKLVITIADIDRFYWNLLICMPFDVALLLRNFVKILHRLWKLWNCIQRFTFFPDTVYVIPRQISIVEIGDTSETVEYNKLTSYCTLIVFFHVTVIFCVVYICVLICLCNLLICYFFMMHVYYINFTYILTLESLALTISSICNYMWHSNDRRYWRLCIKMLGVVNQCIRHNQKVSGRSGDSQHRVTERQVVIPQIFQCSSEFFVWLTLNAPSRAVDITAAAALASDALITLILRDACSHFLCLKVTLFYIYFIFIFSS